MSDIIIGIIGSTEATQELVEANLADLRDKAAADGGAFWGIVGLTPESPEAAGFAIDWFVAEGIAYDLVMHNTIAAQVPEEYTSNADKQIKNKDVENKVVDHLLANDGTHLLVLYGDEDPSDAVQAAAQKAFDADKVVLDLADANLPLIQFGDDATVDEPEETGDGDDAPDWEALGTAADEGDEAAIEKLTELGTEHGLDVDEYTENSYTEFAEMVMDAYNLANEESDSAEDPPKEAPKKAAAGKATPASKATKWTQAELDALDPKELRTIAEQSGIANARKSGVASLKTALLGSPKAAAEEAAPAAEEPKKAPAKGKAAPAKAAAKDEEEPELSLEDEVVIAIDAFIQGLQNIRAAVIRLAEG